MTFEPRKQIGKYAVGREIGSGATSRVYLARDPLPSATSPSRCSS